MIKPAISVSIKYRPSSLKTIRANFLEEIATGEKREIIKKIRPGMFQRIILPDLLLYFVFKGETDLREISICPFFQKKFGVNGKNGKLTQNRLSRIEQTRPKDISIIQKSINGETAFELIETEMESWFKRINPQGELDLFR